MNQTTPNGVPVVFAPREDTNDWNTIFSICGADEYGLRGRLGLTGWALDLGAYVGAFAVCIAADNPGLHVEAVEPVPENLELIRLHAEMNGLGDRIDLIPALVGEVGTSSRIRYGFRGDDGEIDHHGWVGNASNVYENDPLEAHDQLDVPCVDLIALRDGVHAGVPPCFVKVDCEGGEWPALDQLVGLQSPLVVGEWHPVLGHTSCAPLEEAFLAAGYRVTTSGPAGGPGLFQAEL